MRITKENRYKVLNVLSELDDDVMLDILNSFCFKTGCTNYLCDMDELDNEISYCVVDANTYHNSFHIYEVFRDAIENNGFDIYDSYFTLVNNGLKSYSSAYDYVYRHFDNECKIVNYIIEKEDWFGCVELKKALEEMK